MASLMKPLQRALMQNLRSVNAIRYASTAKPPADASKDAKIEKKTITDPLEDPKASYFADPWDILYGAERFEIAMKAKGYNDPYDADPIKVNAAATKENPNVVYTLKDSRMIGCICDEDCHHIKYMLINKGETKRCSCGHWFSCKERELPDLSDYGIILQKPEAH